MTYIPGIGFLNFKEIGPTPPEGSDVWWFARDKRYANYDPFAEFEQPSGSHVVIELFPYIVVKYTPKGVRLQGWLGEEVFVLGNAIRQRAAPTKELALRDLIKRKEKHVRMAEMRLNDAKCCLEMASRALIHESRTYPEGDKQ